MHGNKYRHVGRRFFFVVFVEENTTMSSTRYFENHVSYFVQKPKEVDPIKLISLRQVTVSIALKYEITAYEKQQNQGIDDCNTFFSH